MAGKLAEEALKLEQTSERALHALVEGDLPTEVALSLDGRGERLVRTCAGDRSLALQVALEVRVKLHGLGLFVVRACQPVKLGALPAAEAAHDDQKSGDAKLAAAAAVSTLPNHDPTCTK